MNAFRALAMLALLIGGLTQLPAQPVFIDQPVQAGDLIVFPHITDTTKFYYLPNKIELGTTKDGGPQFSFLRWVENVRSTEEDPNRREGEGGGIIHALVQLRVTDAQIRRAEAALRSRVRSSATIAGPIIYKDGKFTLISSVMDEGGGLSRKVIGLGKAPIFVGNKAAVSVTLTKLGAKILWESCQTPTPDLSFSFQMDMSGYRSPMMARIEVDWDKVYSHEGWNLGIGVNTGYVGLGLDIKSVFDELREQGVIKVINFGADDKMEQIIEAAYKKILDMMFEPFRMPDVFNENSTANQIANGLTQVTKAIKSNSSMFNVNFAYEMKKAKKSGRYVIDLSKSNIETLTFRFDENVGSDVAKCEPCFKQINLDDPLYRQREILVSVDGLNADQFTKYINFVTVSLKKIHGGGQLSMDEVRVGAADFTNSANVFRLLYGWKDNSDAQRDKFLQYQYKVQWSFFGDHTVDQDWRPTDQLGINVAPPFHPMQVSVEADPQLMKDAGIRVAAVKFFYDYGAGEKVEAVTIRSTDQIPGQIAEFMLMNGRYDYDYEITWRLMGNRTVTSGRKKASETLLYVDEIPADAQEVK